MFINITSLTIIFYQNTYELKTDKIILFYSILLHHIINVLCHSILGALLNTQICVSKLYFMNMCAEIEILND